MSKQNLKVATPSNTMEIDEPAGAERGDKFIAYHVNDGGELFSESIQRGDFLICFDKADARRGELAMIEYADGGVAGRYYPAPGGYARLENGRGVEIFKPAEIVRVARVVGVLRDGVYTAHTFRPIH